MQGNAMLEAVKKAWEDSQSRLMRDDCNKTVNSFEALSSELRSRALNIFYDAHDATIKDIGSYDNVTLEGRTKLMKYFRAEARKLKDLDRSKSIALRMYSLWLEGSLRRSTAGANVFSAIDLYFQIREYSRRPNKDEPDDESYDDVDSPHNILNWVCWRYLSFEDWHSEFAKIASIELPNVIVDRASLHEAFRDRVEPRSLVDHLKVNLLSTCPLQARNS